MLPAVLLVADQVTKALIRANMTLGQSIPPEGVSQLTYVTNPYDVFGLPLSPTFFMTSTSIVVILIIWLGCRYLTAIVIGKFFQQTRKKPLDSAGGDII